MVVPFIARFRGLRQEDNEFEASLGYTVRSCHRNKKRSSTVAVHWQDLGDQSRKR
jgi:hypothetical protein